MHDNSPPTQDCGCCHRASRSASLAFTSASLARRSFSFRENIATERARFIRLCLTRVFLASRSSFEGLSSSWLEMVRLESERPPASAWPEGRRSRGSGWGSRGSGWGSRGGGSRGGGSRWCWNRGICWITCLSGFSRILAVSFSGENRNFWLRGGMAQGGADLKTRIYDMFLLRLVTKSENYNILNAFNKKNGKYENSWKVQPELNFGI